ncbi:isoprenyl transferase [Clostridium sp. CAG:167]|nr:isoprenyl transferase [Clostridium sp. CAG:167]
MERSELNAPKHVAIILDGNGRWAKKRHLPRKAGHVEGSKTVEQICEDAYNLGIDYLTVYAFSTENWKRPEDEVQALMKLLRQYLKNCIKRSTKNNMYKEQYVCKSPWGCIKTGTRYAGEYPGIGRSYKE